jgi:heat shock protein HtpX
MALVLVGLGALLGRVLFGSGGSVWGILGAAAIWGAMMTLTFKGGERFVLFAAGAREIAKEDAPRLWNVVEEMAIAAGVPPPRVYLLDSYMQNAFTVGRTLATAGIVVTDGLVRRLTRDELQGVVAHEIGHIRNDDVRFMTIASVMLGSVTLLADSCRRALLFGGGRRSRIGGPQVYLVLMGALALTAVLAPLSARLLYLACAREREFLADASAARFTRYPEGLASALEKISRRVGVTKEASLRALAPLYVVNPLHRQGSVLGIFRTHPPTGERVRILRSMAGAGWVDYERAWREVRGVEGSCLDPQLVASEGSVALRPPDTAPDSVIGTANEGLERVRELAGVIDRDLGRVPLTCECGLRIKVPARFPRNAIACPRCGREHRVPQPESGIGSGPDGALTYKRREAGWDSFRCTCGRVNNLSPGLRVASVRCKGCQQPIRIVA